VDGRTEAWARIVPSYFLTVGTVPPPGFENPSLTPEEPTEIATSVLDPDGPLVYRNQAEIVWFPLMAGNPDSGDTFAAYASVPLQTRDIS
jgi:hypothetical protein